MALWEADDYGIIADRACWALFAVTAVIVALRILCRAGFGANYLGLDDYITVFCLVVILATCILVNIGSNYGLGKHMAALNPADIVPALRYNVIISAVLIWSFSLPKFAIIAILKRILNYGTKTTILFWGLALSSQACILATSIWWFKQCTPVARGWDMTIEGTCAPVSVLANLGYFTSAYSAFLDMFFALYPIPFVMKLNMPLRNRIAVSAALTLSVLACIISIYKLAIFGQVFAILATDPTYPVPFLDILGVSEGCILIITASLPTLGPLVRAVKAKVSTAASGSNTGNSGRRAGNPLANSGKSAPHSRSMSKGWGNRSWGTFKGHKLDDPERSIGSQPSLDGIPLVDAKTTPDWPQGDIQRTVEFSVTSERARSGHGHGGRGQQQEKMDV